MSDRVSVKGGKEAGSSPQRALGLKRAGGSRTRRPIRVLLADGQGLFRDTLSSCLSRKRDMKVVGQVSRASEIADAVARLRPDVLVTDLFLSDAPDGWVLRELRGRCPETRVVLLTAHEDKEHLIKELADGAHGFVLKDAPCALLIKAIRTVAAGGTWVQQEIMGQVADELQHADPASRPATDGGSLTRRERDVLGILAAGNSTAEIAKQLYISQSTVRVHLARVLEKLGLSNRIEAVRYAIKERLVKL